jgi:hypothetical protein
MPPASFDGKVIDLVEDRYKTGKPAIADSLKERLR